MLQYYLCLFLGDDGYVEKKTTNSEFEFIFENLVDATKYNIEAKAFLQQEEPVFQNESISSLSCELITTFFSIMINKTYLF